MISHSTVQHYSKLELQDLVLLASKTAACKEVEVLVEVVIKEEIDHTLITIEALDTTTDTIMASTATKDIEEVAVGAMVAVTVQIITHLDKRMVMETSDQEGIELFILTR
jgi:hypothetical protein